MTRPGIKTQHIGPRRGPNRLRRPYAASAGGRSGTYGGHIFVKPTNTRNLQKEANEAYREEVGKLIDDAVAEFKDEE